MSKKIFAYRRKHFLNYVAMIAMFHRKKRIFTSTAVKKEANSGMITGSGGTFWSVVETRKFDMTTTDDQTVSQVSYYSSMFTKYI